MAIAAFARSKHRPFTSGGKVSVTGNVTVATGFEKSRPIRAVTLALVVSGTVATVANYAPALSWADNGDGTITIYAWKHTSTSNPTLIAATSAVDVMVRVEVD